MLKKLLVANRGEIAVRIIRAAQDLGIATVAVYSAADAESLHVQLADEAVNIGPPAAKKSYLNVEAILKAARDTGCDSVHPGYGFLAENAAFSDAVTGAALVFVGPSGDAIRMMGDKVSARSAAAAAGVPVVPGSAGRVEGLEAGHEVLTATGFPVMIKAAAGGGGRGLRIANSLAEFEQAF
ncbi:acetyl-CoA carboxylase biotin carboxylase subunit, partial [Mesorhizobium sp. M7A.F.Ca.AU.002.02.1.1]|uniref:biotin carboxylase N-terminal domain-containing protein n=1 Tax=Mesorhizobium sp. M7A.F.Ca.AU.002.02.1.1 TaxID=2496671 RepID=UPI000FD30436